jgi:hypothetical protein
MRRTKVRNPLIRPIRLVPKYIMGKNPRINKKEPFQEVSTILKSVERITPIPFV